MSFELFGIENPLLDISATVKDELLLKYNLKPNDAILADEKHQQLFKDILEYPVVYLAGGAAQNTLRGAQWLMSAKSTVYVGAVGKDKECDLLQQEAAKDGLRTEYQYTNLPTGKCAVLITGTHRCLVTDLQAANAFSIDHLELPKLQGLIEQAKFFYIGGYFLTVSPPSAMKIAQHSLEAGKVVAINLAAPFISQFFTAPLMELMPFVNIVFGNEAEAEAFATANNFNTTDVANIALKVAALPKLFSTDRLVIFTQGTNETIVAYQGTVTSYPIIEIDQSKIIDTNGAGDAFVGGFLSQYCQAKSLAQSVAGGHYVANVVIQRTGPSYPSSTHTFTFKE